MTQAMPNRRFTWNRLISTYRWLRHAASHPKTIRKAVSIVVFGHVVAICLLLKHNPWVAAVFLLAYWLCRLVQIKVISPRLRPFHIITLALPNLVAGWEVSRAGELQRLLLLISGLNIPGWIVAVAVGAFCSFMERMAEEHQRTHKRQALASEVFIVDPGQREHLSLDNPFPGIVRFSASVATSLAEPNFAVALLDVNLDFLCKVKRDGRLATGEFDLQAGTFYLRVKNTSASRITIICYATILTRKAPDEDSIQAHPPEPFDSRSIRRPLMGPSVEIYRCEAHGCWANRRQPKSEDD
jgi:hypothetical protein